MTEGLLLRLWIPDSPVLFMMLDFETRNPEQPTASGDSPVTGSANGFLEMYEQHLPTVYRYISYRIQDPQVVADLTSTVFEKALVSFASFDPRKAAPQTWLTIIARNSVIDYFRQSSKRHTVSLDYALGIQSNDPAPHEAVERKEEYDLLRACLALLSTREQEIVALKFGAEMNNRRIAATLGLSDSNVGIIIYRAVIKLKECFTKGKTHATR
jgi:RNA polymerase sigma factor (sigma-70 family)